MGRGAESALDPCLLTTLAVTLGLALLIRRGRRKADQTMRAMAGNLGLSVVRSGLLTPCWTFEGERGGHRAAIQSCVQSAGRAIG